MNASSVALLTVLVMASFPRVFASSPAAEEAFALPALIGMQLSVRKAATQGKASVSLVACVDRLPSQSFVPVFRSLMEQNLSPDEIAATEGFFLSELGRKYAKHGIAQLYVAVGEQPWKANLPKERSEEEFKNCSTCVVPNEDDS